MATGGGNSNDSVGCLDDDNIWNDDAFVEQAVLLAEQSSTCYAPPKPIARPSNFSPPRQFSQPTSVVTNNNDVFDAFAPPSNSHVSSHYSHTVNTNNKKDIVVVTNSFVPPANSHVSSHYSHTVNSNNNKKDIVVVTNSFVPPPAPVQSELDKEQEIDTLKKELSRVSGQLNVLEKECFDLRNERDQKEEQLKVVNTRIEEKVAERLREKNKNLNHFVPNSTEPSTSRVYLDTNQPNNSVGTWTKSCNSIGVQTDDATEFRRFRGSQKLLDLWNSCDEERGKRLVEKIRTDCETEISVLFGYISSGIPYESNMISTENDTKLVEIEKVSLLYSVWTKIGDERSSFKDLIKALVDLSSLKNVVIVHSSLRVLHVALLNSFSMGKNFGKRENVTVVEPLSGNGESEINRCGYSGNESLFLANMTHILSRGKNPSGLRLLSIVKTPGHSGFFSHDRFAESLSAADWVSLFELICQIAVTNTDEKIRVEALSIMNLILTRRDAYSERHEYVGEQLFQNLANLLRKDAGFCVQDLAVHTLHLLCNCPKVVDMLSSDAANRASSSEVTEKISLELLDKILVGLSDCVACRGTATSEELKLRRNAIVFLAFLASCGKPGFWILLNHSLPEDTNFLAVIVQSLISDLELEASKLTQLSNIVREQNLLIREALILLNRLVSNENYSIPVLQALTNTRDMASMTVDLANRLTRNQTTKQFLEIGVMELAQSFQKRVLAYLGDGKS